MLEGSGVTRKIEGEVDEASEIVGKVHVQRGAQIKNSVVRGPAIIGENTILDNAYIGTLHGHLLWLHCNVQRNRA